MSRNTMTRQSIIEEIDKAFRNVNAVCQQYFQNKKNLLKKDPPLQQYKNFNHYKYNQKDNESQHNTTWNNNINQSIELNDDEQNPFQKSYKNPQQYEDNQFQDAEIQREIFKPQQVQKPKVIIQPFRGNSQTGGKYSLAPKTSQIPQIPSPPKAPLSPYFTFYKQKKDLIKQEFPQMSITQLASAAAKVWKSLTQDQKGPYNRKYFEQKREYEKTMAEYVSKYPNYKELLKNNKGKDKQRNKK